jgi:hypothetical protein
MPDGDVFTRSVAPRWRSLVSALRDDLPADECAWRLEDGLAKELRKARGFAHTDLRNLVDAGDADEARVVAGLNQLVRHAAFDRVMPLLVAQGKFPTYDHAQRFMAFCLDTARLDVLARSLVRHPDAKGLRRPPRPHASTSELLSEPASLGARA